MITPAKAANSNMHDFTFNSTHIDIVVPTTAGEQKVIDTWDLTSLDGAWLPPIQVKCLGYS